MKNLQAILCMISNTTKCIKSSRAMHLKFYLSARLGASCGDQIGKSLEMHIYKLMLKIFFPFFKKQDCPGYICIQIFVKKRQVIYK